MSTFFGWSNKEVQILKHLSNTSNVHKVSLRRKVRFMDSSSADSNNWANSWNEIVLRKNHLGKERERFQYWPFKILQLSCDISHTWAQTHWSNRTFDSHYAVIVDALSFYYGLTLGRVERKYRHNIERLSCGIFRMDSQTLVEAFDGWVHP